MEGNRALAAVRGALTPGDADYDAARTVWNAMIDERPAAIVPCADAGAVAEAVRAARVAGLPVSVKGGGHNVAGTAVRDGALTVDLSRMRAVEVDPERRLARVGGGATLADLDRATQAHGLAVPAGVVSDTGVGGLTLGGGFGWLSRLHGLTSDNLVAVEMVTATGEHVRASTEEEPELFWALRGGGGNFGVVTAFEFRLHPLRPEVLFGPVFYSLEAAREVLPAWAAFMETAPRPLGSWADIATAPPAPFLPESAHGTKVVIVIAFWAGDPAEGRPAVAPLLALGTPLGDWIAPRPYVEAQAFLDQTYAKGWRNYWSARNHAHLGTDLAAELAGLGTTLPTAASDILICAHGGAVTDAAPDATAYPHRGALFMTTPGARWQERTEDAAMVAWTRDAAARLEAHAEPGAYVNFIAEREGGAAAAYGANATRLAVVKARWDPENLFRVNQNVAPAPAAAG